MTKINTCPLNQKIKKKLCRYVGEFLNGQKNGRGVMYYRSGESREGTWTKGKLLGRYEQSFKKSISSSGSVRDLPLGPLKF